MLIPDIDGMCHKLDVKEKEFQRWNKPATYLGISIVLIGITAIIFTPQGKNVQYPWESYAGAIYFIIGTPIAFFLSKKARRYKITGFEANAVQTYRAYKLLEKYQKDNLYSQLESAQSHMESVLINIEKRRGDSTEDKPSFKSLTTPIDDFIENLNNRLIPAITKEESKEVTQMLDTLSKVIVLFVGDEFNEIKLVNKEIENNYEDISKGKKSTVEAIKQHKHIVTILISLGIIAAGGIISYSTRFIKADISADTQILAWIGISVPFVVWLIHSRQRR